MKHILYRDAIFHSFQFAWKHKTLWVFGLFAAFLGQIGLVPLLSSVGLAGGGYGGTSTISYLGMLFGTMSFADWSVLSSTVVTSTLWLVIMLGVVALVILALAIVSQGALIHAAARSMKVMRGLPPADKSWHQGATHFWRLFGLQVVKKLILLICGAAVYFSTMRAVVDSTGGWALMSSFAFVLACVVGFVISFLLTYAACYVVVEELSMPEAIEEAWAMFKSHWLVSLEVGIVLLFCNILLGFFAVFAFLVLFTPAFILLIISMIIGTKVLALLAAGVSLILFILFLILIGSIFTVFSTTAWTYVFVKMHVHGVHSKILRWAGKNN